MPDLSLQLTTLSERFAHPSVRVMIRELTPLARALDQGTQVWPSLLQSPAQQGTALPGLEAMEAALSRQRQHGPAVNESDWRGFAQTIRAAFALSHTEPPTPDTPHPAAVIALRLIWGAERFAELPTVVLKPPPVGFLDNLCRLPTPAQHTDPAELDQAVAAWVAQLLSVPEQGKPTAAAANVRGFAHVVAACRVVGQMRAALELEDVAAGYLAWARLLHANLQRLTAVSSGWWSPTDRQLGRHPRNS